MSLHFVNPDFYIPRLHPGAAYVPEPEHEGREAYVPEPEPDERKPSRRRLLFVAIVAIAIGLVVGVVIGTAMVPTP